MRASASHTPPLNFATAVAGKRKADARKPDTKRSRRRPSKSAREAKKSEAEKMRDALPFFRNRTRSSEASWWTISPSGNYSADLETGKRYARAFLPMMAYNCGASSLGTIVSHMALAGRQPESNSRNWRGIDAVALGFLLEIGGVLQGLLGGVAIASCAIKHKNKKLASDFVSVVENGSIFKGLTRATILHDPNATIFDKTGPTAP